MTDPMCASSVERPHQIGNGVVVVVPDLFVFGVADERQRKVVGIPSKEEFRRPVGDVPTGGEVTLVTQYGLDSIQFAKRSDLERDRAQTQRLLSMSSALHSLCLTQDQ